MLCAICQKRRPRRYCPGVRGDICAVCCGTEREVTVRCPSDCEFLMEARKHERTEGLDPATIPHRDITISEEFLEEHSDLISMLERRTDRRGCARPGGGFGCARGAGGSDSVVPHAAERRDLRERAGESLSGRSISALCRPPPPNSWPRNGARWGWPRRATQIFCAFWFFWTCFP